MLISIIIPCFNEKSSIETLLEKVLQQKYLNKQIILVDDCSTDGSTDIIKNKLSIF